MAQLLFLESENPEKPIQIYINSPGGSVTSGMAIYDTVSSTSFISLQYKTHVKDSSNLWNILWTIQMQYIRSPVSTVCIGQACSMGSLLLAGGEHGQRTILPHARVMIHQPRYFYIEIFLKFVLNEH